MKGGMLTRIPPNATSEDQITGLNDVIDKLNTWNGVVVKEGTAKVAISSAANQVWSYPHGLGYAPSPFAFLNGVGLSILPSTKLNIPLPTYLIASSSLVPGAVVETITLKCLVDDENFYILAFNATGVALSGVWPIRYYLMRLASEQ